MGGIKGCAELARSGWAPTIEETKKMISKAGSNVEGAPPSSILPPELRHPRRSFDTFECEGVVVKIDNDSWDLDKPDNPNREKLSSAKLIDGWTWAY